MRAILPWLAALVVVISLTSLARAQYPCGPGCAPPYPPMVDPNAGGYYGGNPYGIGGCYPGYCGLPPMPFNGIMPNPGFQRPAAAPPAFPFHPYFRSPRDYFMYEGPR
ncbi:MAG: hypothetical protein K2R98_34455 [Gemmataceae bacterium]|nr:hypothetical protein [Gemmataceae bacterium]